MSAPTPGTRVVFVGGAFDGRTGIWGRDETGRPYVAMSNGSRAYNPSAVRPLTDPAVAAERADDALLDRLGDRDTPDTATAATEPLSRLLLAWRRHTDAHPVGVLVDTDTALAAIAAARPRRTAWEVARDFAARAAFRLTHRLRTPRSTR